MRRRGRLSTLTPAPSSAADSRTTGAYDWMRFGRHRLRAPASVVVDLPCAPEQASHAWIATIWPAVNVPGGWARHPWQPDPTGRGWVLPQQLAAGDVLEFGTHTAAGGWQLWYGVLDAYEFDRWLTVQGPYTDAAAAHDDAQLLLAAERFLPPLELDDHAAVEHTRCRDVPRRRRRGSSAAWQDGQQRRWSLVFGGVVFVVAGRRCGGEMVGRRSGSGEQNALAGRGAQTVRAGREVLVGEVGGADMPGVGEAGVFGEGDDLVGCVEADPWCA